MDVMSLDDNSAKSDCSIKLTLNPLK